MVDPITRLETFLSGHSVMGESAWLEQRILSEDVFAVSYDTVDDIGRARLKTCMAGLFDAYPPTPTPEICIAKTSPSGQGTYCIEKPHDVCVVAFNDRFQSPARLLACLIPAVTARIPLVLVVGIGMEYANWPPALVVAMELAGIEAVLSLEQEMWATFLTHVAGVSDVCIITPQHSFFESHDLASACRSLPTWQPTMHPGVGIIAEEQQVDEETLRFCHAGESIQQLHAEMFGRASGSSCTQNVYEDLPGLLAIASEYDPTSFMHASSLVVQSGRESDFIWPELSSSFFRSTRRCFLAKSMATLAMPTMKTYSISPE
ncbi:hypothetical protein [Desulfovibrio inopinatus]|uniref:hypothetical protein n=1 Tax=Desulfovibrio inopinatus TaxID=102109 RepID=UPI0003F76190|nr:hypothetical protein [Desulfovibrio inopinatus]